MELKNAVFDSGTIPRSLFRKTGWGGVLPLRQSRPEAVICSVSLYTIYNIHIMYLYRNSAHRCLYCSTAVCQEKRKLQYLDEFVR